MHVRCRNNRLWRLACLGMAAALAWHTPPAARATTAEHGPSAEVMPEANADKIEIGRLRLQNTVGGIIEGSRDGGLTWELIGHILRPSAKVNVRGFNASKYAPSASIAATAVNAIHLKASQNEVENRGVIWSLAPAAESSIASASIQTEISPDSSAFTDIPGGQGIFGGPFTPYVANPISLDNARNNTLSPLPAQYVPAVGDVWVVQILRPRRYPRQVVFENRFGGLVTIEYRGETPRVIGQVLRPVLGIGRFQGSYFSDVGRLRANHCGVIDISTSPRGKVGSFQIVPANHAMSPETNYIRELTQWMVIGPASVLEPSWEGTAPLYSSFLRPRYDPGDLQNPDPVEGLAGRFVFEVRKKNNETWEKMPTLWMEPNAALPKWAGTALADVTHFRIVFPFAFDEPLTITPNKEPHGQAAPTPAQ